MVVGGRLRLKWVQHCRKLFRYGQDKAWERQLCFEFCPSLYWRHFISYILQECAEVARSTGLCNVRVTVLFIAAAISKILTSTRKTHCQRYGWFFHCKDGMAGDQLTLIPLFPTDIHISFVLGKIFISHPISKYADILHVEYTLNVHLLEQQVPTSVNISRTSDDRTLFYPLKCMFGANVSFCSTRTLCAVIFILFGNWSLCLHAVLTLDTLDAWISVTLLMEAINL